MTKFSKLLRGKALYQTPDKIWIARGMTFFAVDYNGKRVSRKYRVGSLLERFLGCHRLSSQLLRVGLHHLLPLNNGNLLVTAKRKTFIIAPSGEIVNV